jgi:hypothetical protein
VIAEMGINFLERQVLRRGHQLKRVPEPEYGTDALMLHFSPGTCEIENGWVEFQVKATERMHWVDGGRGISCTVEVAHVRYWQWEIAHPVILVLYEAERHRAYWLNIQDFIDKHPPADQQTLAVQFPATNKVTLRAIDRFRKMSLTRAFTSNQGG